MTSQKELITYKEASEIANHIHDRLIAEIEEGRIADAKRLECSECLELRQQVYELEKALLDLYKATIAADDNSVSLRGALATGYASRMIDYFTKRDEVGTFDPAGRIRALLHAEQLLRIEYGNIDKEIDQ